ncbi:MAG: TraR/DksA C4-type zinc finger protein [Rubrivivax sp.]
MRRIETDAYGLCSNCGTEIPFDRLKAEPWAELRALAESAREEALHGAGAAEWPTPAPTSRRSRASTRKRARSSSKRRRRAVRRCATGRIRCKGRAARRSPPTAPSSAPRMRRACWW